MFTVNLDEVETTEIMYSITRGGWLYYVGKCRLAEFGRFPDARWHSVMGPLMRNPEFLKGASAMVLGVGPGNTQKTHDQFWDFILAMKPQHRPEPKPSVTKGRKTREIIHNETGEVYRSASEACEALELQQAALSRHLNGLIRHVKGQTFSYVDE